jgi:undecaprenyl phosphate-alpha-L-ara4N flippase subunit ArnE
MNPTAALWTSIVLGGCAQVMLRKGVQNGNTRSPRWWMSMFASNWVAGWAVCFAAATILWMVALARIDISYAFPLLGSSYLLVALLSRWLLKESIPPRRWLAIAVVSVGVALSAGK